VRSFQISRLEAKIILIANELQLLKWVV